MPDELTPPTGAQPEESAPTGSVDEDAPPAPGAPPQVVPAPVLGSAAPAEDVRPPRRPSWLRAVLLSLAIVAAGTALGAAVYHYERTYLVQAPEMSRTDDGWRIVGRQGRRFSGLALDGPRLLWQNGPSIEYADLDEGWIRLLGPGAGMRTTWAPDVDERYAIWFEAERPQSLAAQAVAYDTRSGRRWTVAEIGSVYSYPSLSGDVAVWCSARKIAAPAVNGVRIGSGQAFEVAAGYGAPVVSGGLVVWATSENGPFTARELSGGRSWPVAAGLSRGRLTAVALAGRTLVWGQSPATEGSGIVAATSVDGGDTQALASGVGGLAGPAFDGTTVVWAEKSAGEGGAQRESQTGGDYRVMGRRLSGGPSFLVAEVKGSVDEVAVSGNTVAWIASSGGFSFVETTELPR